MFHVEQFYYLPNNIRSILMSAGDTPGILDACPIVAGLIFASFSLASVDNASFSV